MIPLSEDTNPKHDQEHSKETITEIVKGNTTMNIERDIKRNTNKNN